jgi:hypothetical protein
VRSPSMTSRTRVGIPRSRCDASFLVVFRATELQSLGVRDGRERRPIAAHMGESNQVSPVRRKHSAPNPSSPSHSSPSAPTHHNSQAEPDPQIRQESDILAAETGTLGVLFWQLLGMFDRAFARGGHLEAGLGGSEAAKTPSLRGFLLVGLPGFEPGTSSLSGMRHPSTIANAC